LQALKGSLKEAYVIIDSRYTKMVLVHQDDKFDYFVADFGRLDTNIVYYFILKDGVDSLRFPTTEGFRPRGPLFIPPGWASCKTYYNIFPDGFHNGDVTNDPKKILKWGEKPENWFSYGGDLKGIVQRLPYLDSLDIDIIILQPIFTAASNHKFNSRDYITIDPAFGDTSALENLINEVHNRKKKIILAVMLTHTGIDFPAFADILKNDNKSRYFNWYSIHTTPVRLLPQSYDCWRSDYRFPKLNLKESQVKSYLIGYLEYWGAFGFDGFYIGEDDSIDTGFISDLRIRLKAKYPNILILGSDTRRLTGSGFDGNANQNFTQLLINYFIKNTIATTDFDREIRRMLNSNPSQANCINLISPSSYEQRITSVATEDVLKIIYAFIFTFCGSPVILFGGEVGMVDGVSLNLGSFPWSLERQNRNLLQEIKRLINIRKVNPPLTSKYFFTLYVDDINKIYAYDRGGIITILNSGDSQSVIVLPALSGSYIDLISGDKFTVFSQRLKLLINARSYRILKHGV